MKMSCVCLVLGLVLLFTVSSEAPPIVFYPHPCCSSFVLMKIPPNKIIKVEKLDWRCTVPGYVVTTVAGKKICVENYPGSTPRESIVPPPLPTSPPADPCCREFVTIKIPTSTMINVEKLDERCPKPGYLVTTAAGKRICVEKNPC